jgi:hypothetical protein
MTVPFWDDDPDSWDNVFLGGEVLPGSLNRIENLKAGKRKTDIKTAPGTDGASIADQGYEPATFTIVIEAFFSQEVLGLQRLIAKIKPRKDKPLTAYTVTHPLLVLQEIESAYVLDIQTEKGSEKITCKLACIEFIPLRTAKGSGKVKIKTKESIEEAFLKANPNSILGSPGNSQDNPNALTAVRNAARGSLAALKSVLPGANVKPSSSAVRGAVEP